MTALCKLAVDLSFGLYLEQILVCNSDCAPEGLLNHGQIAVSMVRPPRN
jgi:hypothetical protein